MSELTTTPYELIGGGKIRELVDRFYDLLESEPGYAALRALHSDDLGPTRAALTGFLTVWLGGPRDWLAERGGFCIMSRHAKVGVSEATAGQWMAAMERALADSGIEPGLGARMKDALGAMAQAMVP